MKYFMGVFFLMFAPLVLAVTDNFTMSWSPYTVDPQATIHVMCQLTGTTAPTEVASALATSNSVDFTKDVPVQSSLTCFVFAQDGSVKSPNSSPPVVYTEVLVLPSVGGCTLIKR